MMNFSEKNFEQSIECPLLYGGPDACSDNEWTSCKLPSSFGDFTSGSYRKRRPDQYDRHLYLDPDAVLDFIYATQRGWGGSAERKQAGIISISLLTADEHR